MQDAVNLDLPIVAYEMPSVRRDDLDSATLVSELGKRGHLRPVANLVVLMNVDPVAIPAICYERIVRHVIYSDVDDEVDGPRFSRMYFPKVTHVWATGRPLLEVGTNVIWPLDVSLRPRAGGMFSPNR
jgi:hypothetical protein